MNIRLVTVVWGGFFVETFLRVTARSLLAEGNAASLSQRHTVIYTIQTTIEGKLQLETSPVFQTLAAAIPIEFQIFDPAQIDPRNLAQHWFFWRKIAEIARKNRELLFFVIPDMLFAAGTLVRWSEFFERGYHAVWTSVPQVALETVFDEIERHFPPSAAEPVSLDASQIHDLFIRQMHPLMVTMFRDSHRWIRHPEIVFVSVPGQGLAMRAICSHLFCIDLEHFPITSDAFSPIDRLKDIAFDQLSHGVCLERLLKHADLYYRPKRMDSDRLSNLGSWIDMFCVASDMLESYHTYRYFESGRVDEEGFLRAAASLGFYACQVRLTGAIYRAVRAIRGAGCRVAAQILATAHFAARLRRHWRIKGEVTILVPTDAGISALSAGLLEKILAPGSESALIDAVLAHTVPGKLRYQVGDGVVRAAGKKGEGITSATGKTFSFAQKGPLARIVAGPIEVDDCTIYVIDQPLLSHSSKRSGSLECSGPSYRWASSPRRAMRRSSPKTVSHLQVQFTVRSLLRIGRRLVAAVPGARRLAHRIIATYSAPMRRRGVGAESSGTANYIALQIALIQQRVMGIAKSRARAVLRTAHRVAMALPLTRGLAQRAAASYRLARQGLAEAGLQPIPTPMIAWFRDIQAARVVLNLAELLRLHRDKVADLTAELPPLAMVEACLERIGISDDRLMAELRRVLEAEPGFAEAWLELGYAHFDRGNYAAAEGCFDKALTTAPALAVTADRTGCAAQAALAKARALEVRGKLSEAAEAYAKALASEERASMARIAYAKLLRRLGRGREALPQFEAGMESDYSLSGMEALPDRFSSLADRLSARFAQIAKV